MRSRWFGLVIAAVAVAVSIWAYPRLPPTVATHWDLRGANYDKFLSSYWLIANAVIVFVLVAHAMIIASALGYSVRIDRLMPLGFGLLFIFLGNYITRVEPHWFVG